MRIERLKIAGFRGITAPIEFNPSGKSLVLHGPNGSGKSSVIDAVDFLLTGGIRRLSGTGMQKVTLAKHAHHVDVEPGKAYVEADITLEGLPAAVSIRRSLADPHSLEVPEDARDAVEAALSSVQRGLHLLTRREILAFIAIEPGKRLAQVEHLLNLDGIGQTRKTLVSTENQAKYQLDQAEGALAAAELRVAKQVGKATYQEAAVLEAANSWRQVLGGAPLRELTTSSLKKQLPHAPQEEEAASPVNPATYARDFQALVSLVDDVSLRVQVPLGDLRYSVGALRTMGESRRVLDVDGLVVQGISLLDDSGLCPLCDTRWEPSELRQHLEEKHASASEYSQLERTISSHARGLRDTLTTVVEAAADLVSPLASLEIAEAASMRDHVAAFQSLVDRLKMPLDLHPDDSLLQGNGALSDAWEPLVKAATACKDKVTQMFPAPSAARDAWDELTRLEVHLNQVGEAIRQRDRASLLSARATTARQSFERARDTVLTKIYADIRNRFERYYRTLHGDDEAKFQANLHPRKGALDFEVDFYGRGKHSPLAFHSEGHQDSMGICLFLALGDYLGARTLDLFLLDDVVMSVDVGHRRRLAELLRREFPERQFIITTHDGTWARQLKTVGLISGKTAMVELFGWSVHSGPTLDDSTDPFDRLRELLDNEDVPGAAHLLRRHSEAFFRGLAESLQAKVVFRGNGRWELQDFVSGVVSAYSTYLKLAARHAKQYGSTDEELDALEEARQTFQQILARAQVEQWAINDNVHYNNWPEFSVDDFRPVIEAFEDLYNVFICPRCGSEVRTVGDGKPEVLKCECGRKTFNLASA